MKAFKYSLSIALFILASLTTQASLPGFNGTQYLIFNPDVAKAGINPVQHFINFGYKEGRIIAVGESTSKAMHLGTFSLNNYLSSYPNLKTNSDQSIPQILNSLFSDYQTGTTGSNNIKLHLKNIVSEPCPKGYHWDASYASCITQCPSKMLMWDDKNLKCKLNLNIMQYYACAPCVHACANTNPDYIPGTEIQGELLECLINCGNECIKGATK